MKVLIVTPYFYPSIGGVQNYVLSMANSFKKMKIDIVIVTTGSKGGSIITETVKGFTVYRLPYQFKLSNTPVSLRWRRMLKEIIINEKPDFINAHTPVPYLADIAARANKSVPFILNYHNDLVKPSFLGKVTSRLAGIVLIRSTLRKSDLIITQSPSYLRSSTLLNRYRDKVKFIAPGVDIKRFNQNIDKEKIKLQYPGKKLILFVASLDRTHAHKGLPVLIKAVEKLSESNERIHLLVIGSGDALSTYRQLASDLGITDLVTFIGAVSENELPHYYAAADVFTLPSTNRSEGFGMVLAEAQACGTPVVGSNVGGIPTAIEDGITGLLIEPNNVEQLSDAMARLLSDTKLAKKISEASRQKARSEYSWQVKSEYFWAQANALKSLSVTHVVASYLPRIGGMEQVVGSLAATQRDEGLNVTIISSDVDYESSYTDTDGLTVKRLKAFEIAHTPIIPGLVSALMRVKRNSVIHVHVAQAFIPEIVWVTSKLKRSPYVAQIHLDVSPSGPLGFLLKIYKPLLLRPFLRGAAAVVVFTQAQRDSVHMKYGVDMDKIYVIRNGVNEEYFYEKARKVLSKPRLLYVGRLSVQKNIQQLLRTLDTVSSKFATTIVGAGEEESNLLAIVKQLNLRNVEFVGKKMGKELLMCYIDADIFVLPSEREGMPLVLLEAMAMGLPVVATDIEGNRGLIHEGINGYLVGLNDYESMRKKITLLGSNKRLYSSMSSETRKLSKHYSWKTIVKDYNRLYRGVQDENT